jgi:uroporphyrin-III C-methyltransferase/precorrin-2 dehydrogenase/sirohydrochlorin ferrochelatase
MARLAKLPVFWALESKRVVVIGGSEAAAWKAELLAACGAEVEIHADKPGQTMLDIIQAGPEHPRGRLILRNSGWSEKCLVGAALVVADCDDEEDAAKVYQASVSSGVPVNVIDKPAFCQFQFGSIVNRSPVVVSISTDGAAPVLAQAIRRRVETLLPPFLKEWGELAQSVRSTVNARLAPGVPRRAFWERFVDRAFRNAPANGEADIVMAEMQRISMQGHLAQTGRVTLVGAGPGDPELLTLKAVRALQAADVILFDDLVSDEVLELARREAKRMLVGKRGGRESCRQEDINDMMVALAKAGRQVVRLKSGDPTVFGRAGEEVDRLRAEGIPVDVIPGITAASAMAARLGISLTHRDHAQGVRFLTGHAKNGMLPANIDWQALCDVSQTTVLYMAGRTAPQIFERLTFHGLPRATPVAVASGLTRVDEAIWTGPLGEMVSAVADIGMHNPIVIGIGPVFSNANSSTGIGSATTFAKTVTSGCAR